MPSLKRILNQLSSELCDKFDEIIVTLGDPVSISFKAVLYQRNKIAYNLIDIDISYNFCQLVAGVCSERVRVVYGVIE